MATRLAAEPFWKLLHKSGILPPEDAQSLQRELREQPPGLDSAEKVANELVAREVLTKWQADQLLQGKHRGFFLGPYRIQSILGKGGMGAVFLAEHQMMRRLCAIKVLPPERCRGNPSLIKRFYREAQAVAALDHPNIVRAYDVNKATLDETEVHYLVMEYIGGMDLQRRVDSQGVLGYRDAAKFIRQAAEGLAHAHDRGFVHRDIKPANLLLDSSGTVKILDLGLARFFDPASDASLSGEHGEILGTADYLAPEQAMNSHAVDGRADIYSLGQTGYFLLTGHAPFPTGTVAERLMAHQMKSPEPIDRERPDAPPALLKIIERMIAKKPESRYQSAQEVSESLDKWLNQEDEEDDLEGFASRFRQHFGPSQPTSHEPTRSGSSSAEETDLELAPLEDEKSAPTASGKSATSDSRPPSAAGKSVTSDSTPPPASGKSATSDSTAPSASGVKPASKSGVQKTPVPKAKPDGSEAKAKGVAGLLDDLTSDLASSGSHPGTTPGQQLLRPKRKRGLDKAISSPLFWIVVAASTVVLLVIVITVASSSSEAPTASPPAIPAPAEPEKQRDTKPTPPPEPTPPKSIAPPREGVSPSRVPDLEATSNAPVTEETKPPGQKPTVVSPKPPEDKQETQPEKPVQRTPEKPEPVNPKALFAGVSEFSTELKSFDRDQDSAFHTTVNRILGEAAGRANLKMNKTKAAVMTITLSAPEKDEKVHLMISAVLKCRDPENAKARAVTVWEHEQELGVVSKRLFKAKGVPVRIIRRNVVEFFARFAKDYEEAQTPAEKQPIP